ncbi:acyl-CoA thioester hydrolase/BAAT C-terminal domain-containing protein [Aurantiacibacter sediminis]|uniref:Dienelactone hydrolase family protein n=1 Tax=Aurantiacibacter sediminis TaxID=2793064 RepID=A0ABS0N2S4_9SPHN|nr:acyl-CoA thioester hydrolase/BAAT C-terminal domain-containing protein [Aurantiacibacter sediminis]MBH5322266.1 dienelactone hydrolase family protein [Aurantiacibacter sediminis]
MQFRHIFAFAAACVVPVQSVNAQEDAASVSAEYITAGESLPGAFLALPEGDGPYPVIIVLGGSEGGDSSARTFAQRFAPEGYAVFGLPYYSPAREGDRHIPGLPNAFADIPVDTLEIALDWLQSRPEIRADAIGIYGVSKGAEMALLGGTLIDGFAAIAAIVPSDVVWEGWGAGRTASSFSWRGEPLPFVPYLGMGEEFANPTGPEGRPRIRLPHDRGRNANPDRAVIARIPVENIDEPVLVAGGDADLVWNSGEMAQAIAERRVAAGLETVSLVFTDAGHYLSGDGSRETGNPANQFAQQEIWPATLAFFAEHLRGETPSE